MPAERTYYPFYLVLLQMGFTRPASHLTAGELLPHHFALTWLVGDHEGCPYIDARRYVSVALSLRSLSLAVSQHPALRSSDFPRTLQPAIASLTQTHFVRLAHEGIYV